MGHGRVVVDPYATPLGHEQITGISSAKGLTAATYEGASFAMIQAQDQDVRWRDDGTDPTTTAGMVLAAGQSLNYYGDLSAIKLIEATATAKVNVAYYRV